MADPNGTKPPGSNRVPPGMAKIARSCTIPNNPSLGSCSSTASGSIDSVVEPNRLVGGVRQKKSSFQITSVTVGSRLSNDGGEDSADDLDESHTEDLSSDVLDVSKTTDYECSSEDAFSSIKDDGGGGSVVQSQVNVSSSKQQQHPAVTMFSSSSTTASNPNSNVSVTVVEAANVPMSVVQHPEIQWQNRFRVVKIETSEPFRRGRWLCMDFLDPPPASSAQSELGDREASSAGGGSGGGGVGSGNSSGTGSMPHGESLIMETAAAGMLQQQHPVAASWSAESSAVAAAAVANAAFIGGGGYGQETMPHGVTYAPGMIEAPLYPVSIILQTQQQGNLDFTNTALHMQGRTTAAHHPSTRPSHPNPPPPTPNPQQQPGTMTTTVGPPGTDFHGGGVNQTNLQTRDYIQPDLQQQAAHNNAVIQHQMTSQPTPVPVATMVQMEHPTQCHTVPQTEFVVAAAAGPPPSAPAPPPQQTIMFPTAAVPSADYGIIAQQAQSVIGTVPVVANQPQQPTTTTTSREQQAFQPQPAPPSIPTSVQVVTDSSSIVPQPPLSSQDGVVLPGSNSGSGVQSQSSGVQSSTSSVISTSGQQQNSANAAAAGTGTATSPPVLETSGEEGDGESASGASTVAIDNKIEQAMDLVKSHLMFAVREEVDVLKEKITELMERINQLEYENNILKASASPDTLAKLSQAPNTSAT